MKAFIAIIAATLLTACATSPMAYNAATPVAPSNLLDGYTNYTIQREGYSRVIVVRDSGMHGAGLMAKLTIDGVGIAKFWSGQRLELFLQPAVYVFGIQASPSLGHALVETTYDIKQGKGYGFRISLDNQVGTFSFQQSTHVK
jgi:opacity protein-like surface antigen